MMMTIINNDHVNYIIMTMTIKIVIIIHEPWPISPYMTPTITIEIMILIMIVIMLVTK